MPKAGAARQVHVVRKEQVDRGRYQKSTSERRRASEWSRQKGRRQIIKALCSKRLARLRVCVAACIVRIGPST